MAKVKISDCSIKQAGKSDDIALSFREKIELCKMLDKLNLDYIELEQIENVKVDSLLVKSVVSAISSSKIAIPVALGGTPGDTAKALSEAKSYRLQVIAPVSAVRMEYVCHKKPAAVKDLVKETISECLKYTDDVEFIAEDAVRADRAFLCEIISIAIDAGAKTVTLSDDAGVVLPEELALFIREIKSEVKNIKNINLGINCSNTITLADACVIAGLKEGLTELKASAYPGDIANLANIAKIIPAKTGELDVQCNINTTRINRVVSQIKRLCTGEHSVKSAFEYSVEDDEEVISINDDMSEIIHASEKLGYELTPEDAASVFAEVKRLLGKSKRQFITGRELDAIIATTALQVPATYTLESYVSNTCSGVASMVFVRLLHKDEVKEGVSTGDGPVDAAFHAIESIIGRHFELDDFQIRAVTEGNDAAGETIVKLRYSGKVYSGRGLSTDIISASIRAYLNALNKLVYEEEA